MDTNEQTAARYEVHQGNVPGLGPVIFKFEPATGQAWVLVQTSRDRTAFHWAEVAPQDPRTQTPSS